MTLDLRNEINTALDVRQRLADVLTKEDLTFRTREALDDQLRRLEHLAVNLRLAEEEAGESGTR